ncbi:hypothetical protein ACA910_007888 [Epithemia clementina (nom. ined.)]
MSIQSIPHGWYSIVPTILSTLGWLFGLFQDGCDFVRVEGEIVEQIASQPNAPYLEAGRNAYREPRYNAKSDSWRVEYTGQCLIYPEEKVDIDMWWNVAKGFDFASLVLGGSCSLFLWFSACCVFSRGTWRLAGFQVLLASFFQALSFLWFRTELCQTNDCFLFWGSKSDIAACIFWLMAAILIFCRYPVPKDLSRDNGDGLVLDRPLSRDDDSYQANMEDDYSGRTEPETTTITSGDQQIELKDEDQAYDDDEDDPSSQGGQYSGEDSRQISYQATTPAQIV